MESIDSLEIKSDQIPSDSNHVIRRELDWLKAKVENLEMVLIALKKENEALAMELKYNPDGKYILETVKPRFETGDYSRVLSE